MHFNSRPRMGATQPVRSDAAGSADFNSRPRMGATVAGLQLHGGLDISIRAPAWGRPGWQSPDTGLDNFNSRPRMGATGTIQGGLEIYEISIRAPAWGRPSPPLCAALRHYFNSRPRMGATDEPGLQRRKIKYFNSRPRMGATSRPYSEIKAEYISIRAPAWGRPQEKRCLQTGQ